MTLGCQNATLCSGRYFLEFVTQLNNDFTAIMAEFPTITWPCSKDRPMKHDITYNINTTGPFVSVRPRRLAPEQLKIAWQEFKHMLELAIIRPLSSSWSFPVHTVVKKSGDWHRVLTIENYTLDSACHLEVVSLDHLKPADLESELVTDVDTFTQATSTAQPTKSPVIITHSGQRTYMPVHFS